MFAKSAEEAMNFPAVSMDLQQICNVDNECKQLKKL